MDRYPGSYPGTAPYVQQAQQIQSPYPGVQRQLPLHTSTHLPVATNVIRGGQPNVIFLPQQRTSSSPRVTVVPQQLQGSINPQTTLPHQGSNPLATYPQQQGVPPHILATIQQQAKQPILRNVNPPAAPIVSGFVVHPSSEDDKNKSSDETSSAEDVSLVMPSFDNLIPASMKTNVTKTMVPLKFGVEGGYDTKLFSTLVKNLVTSSSFHATVLNSKQDIEQQAMIAHKSLWSFPTMEKKIRGEDYDGSPAVHVIQYKIATFNETTFKSLQQQFHQLHSLIFRPVWLSLYEQTFYELEVSRYVNEFASNNDVSSLKIALEVLCDNYSEYKKNLSPHAAAVMRGVILFVGGCLLGYAEAQPQQMQQPQRQELLLDFMTQPTQQVQQRQELGLEGLHVFILEKLISLDGCHWARSLLQPTIQALVDSKLLSKLIERKERLTEHDVVAILSQIPWNDVTLIPVELIMSDILLPIQNLLEHLTEQKYLNALSIATKILLVIDEKFPDLKLTTIAIITRSPWPLKAVASPYLGLIRWNTVPAEDLQLIFAEFYQLAQPPINEYAKLPFGERSHHVDTFGTNMCSDQTVVEQVYNIDTKIASLNHSLYSPMFSVFAQLAEQYRLSTKPIETVGFTTTTAGNVGSPGFPSFDVFLSSSSNSLVPSPQFQDSSDITGDSTGSCDLAQLIVEELFQFAFGWYPSPAVIQSNQQVSRWVVHVKQGAIRALVWLCSKDPNYYLQLIIKLLGQHLTFVAPQHQNVTYFLSMVSSSVWNQLVPGEQILNVLSYFISRRHFSAIPSPQSPEYVPAVGRMFAEYLTGKPVTMPHGEAAASIGTKIFDCLKWTKASISPQTKIKGLMILVMFSPGNVDGNWVISAVDRLAPELVNPPFDYPMAINFIQWHQYLPQQSRDQTRSLASVLLMLQLLVSCGLVKDHYLHTQDPTHPGSQSQYTVRWFSQEKYLNIYDSMFTAPTTTAGFPVSVVLSKFYNIADAIKFDPLPEVAQNLGRIIEKHVTGDALILNFGNLVATSLSAQSPKQYAQWLALWSKILLSKLQVKRFIPLINDFTLWLFSQQINFEEVSMHVRQNPLSKREIVSLLPAFPWAAYVAIWGFEPRLPPQRQSNAIDFDLGPLSFIKNAGLFDTALWLWRDLAMQITDNYVAVAFWERFFLLYFEVISLYGDVNYFSQAIKTELNEHFTKVARTINTTGVERVLYQIYYSFTTWSKDIIFTTGNNLFTSNNNELLNIFLKAHPPRITGKPATATTTATATIAPTATKTISPPSYLMTSSGATRVIYLPPPATVATQSYPPPSAIATVNTAPTQLPLSLAELLPPRLSKTPDEITKSERSYFHQYKSELEQNILKLEKCKDVFSENSGSVREVEIPLVDDLIVLLQQSKEITESLRETDDSFLSLTRKQYYNHPYTYTATHPFIMQVSTYKIGPEYPGVIEDMQANRRKYEREYLTYFDIARSISHSVSLACDLKDYLLACKSREGSAGMTGVTGGNSSQSSLLIETSAPQIPGQIFPMNANLPPQQPQVPQSQPSEIEILSVTLFFKLLPMVLNSSIPFSSPILSSVIRILKDIGREFIANRATTVQVNFLRQFLKLSKPISNTSTVTVPVLTGNTAITTISNSTPLLTLQSRAQSQHKSQQQVQQPLLQQPQVSLLDGKSLLSIGTSTPSVTTTTTTTNTSTSITATTTNPQESRADLISLITPTIFLIDAHRVKLYLEMLLTLASVQSEVSPEEESEIASKFQLDSSIPFVLQNSGAEEIETLFTILKHSLMKSSLLSSVSSPIIEGIMNLEFPKHAERLLYIVLTTKSTIKESGKQKTIEWDKVLGKQWQSRLSLEQAHLLINLVHSSISATNSSRYGHIGSACALMQTLVLDTPFKDLLVSENAQVFVQEFSPERAASSSWTVLELFMASCLSNPSGGIHERNFSHVLQLISKVVETCPTLIDRIWYFFTSKLVPYLTEVNINLTNSTSDTSSDSSTETIGTLISYTVSLFSSLPWEKSTFHYHDTESISTLLALFEFPSAVTWLIFGKLDWDIFAKKVEERNTSLGKPYKYSNGHVTKFLNFFLSLNIVSPTSVPSGLRSRIFGISTNEDWFFNGLYVFDWRGIPPEEFQTEFGGDRLIGLVRSGIVTEDPTSQVMESLSLLCQIVRFIGNHSCVRQAVKELHTFLFHVLGSVESEGRYWYLPFQDQLKIVSSMIVPLVLQYDNILAENKMKLTEEHLSPLVLLISCATDIDTIFAKDVYLAPLKFSNSNTAPSPSDPQVMDFHDKMQGLVRRFCSSATSDRIALQILSAIPKALSSCENTLILLLEETLRTFLTHAPILPGKSTLEKCIGVMKFPSHVSWARISASSLANMHMKLKGAPILFRLLLEQELVALEERGASDSEWLSYALSVFEPILRFSPDRHRQFEILILWFFLLELMSDRRFSFEEKAVHEKVNLFKIQLQAADMDFITKKLQITRHSLLEIDKDENVPLFLASKAIFVFLHRIVSAKMVDASAILQTKDATESLAILSTQPISTPATSATTILTYQDKFPKFFQEMKSINSSFFGLNSFEVALLSTLFPIAPHILKLVKMSEEDIEKLGQSEILGIVVGTSNNNMEDEEKLQKKSKKGNNNNTNTNTNNNNSDNNNNNNDNGGNSTGSNSSLSLPSIVPTNIL